MPELPDRPVVSLTEAITWSLDGRARTDEEMRIASGVIEHENHARWDSFWGPGWLLKPLERMRSGQIVEKISSSSHDDEIRVAALLERKQWDVETAYEQVFTELQEIEAASARLERFYDTLFKACEWERVHIEGIKVSNRRRDTFPHKLLPAEYFSRPTLHIMGKGYHGYGELGPKLTPQQTFDAIFDPRQDVDRRETYIRARIRRGDLLALKEEASGVDERLRSVQSLNLSASIAAAASSSAAAHSCYLWLSSEMKRSPGKKLGTKEAYWEQAQDRPDLQRLSRRSFDDAWSKAVHAVSALAWSAAGAPRGKRSVALSTKNSPTVSKINAPIITAAK